MDNFFLIDRLKYVNLSFFNLCELPSIKWSRGQIKKKYRRITFGCYDIKKNEIRIHPVFKTAVFPEFVLDFVIYHELLHYVDRDIIKQEKRLFRYSRRKIHNKSFKTKEKMFPNSDKAIKLLKRFVECRD
ncbi:MAG: hypothetical protein N2258_02030 [Brevinematales bacterium]|nr:hypothetical protein [Brevinematales bacterium]